MKLTTYLAFLNTSPRLHAGLVGESGGELELSIRVPEVRLRKSPLRGAVEAAEFRGVP